MKQLCNAIKYLHERKIIHRDLKTDNILLHFKNKEDREKLKDFEIKLIDFGFATILDTSNVAQYDLWKSFKYGSTNFTGLRWGWGRSL